MQIIKAVIDVNIWIAHFICNRGFIFKEFVVDNGIILFRSSELTKELNDVINRQKFRKYSTISPDEFVELYLSLTNHFETQAKFEDCPDKKDNYLFDLAIQSKSKYLVSGDKIVLETKVKSSLKLITLAEFKQIFS